MSAFLAATLAYEFLVMIARRELGPEALARDARLEEA
jgi:hypothetical protein